MHDNKKSYIFKSVNASSKSKYFKCYPDLNKIK